MGDRYLFCHSGKGIMGHTRDARPYYLIKKIFGPTFQGEGTHVGRKVLFVRFAGCNRWDGRAETKAASVCDFCDTNFRNGTRMTIRQIVEELIIKNGRHVPSLPVVLSGGEPSLQIDEAFLIGLLDSFPELHIETNGSRPLVRPRRYKHITMSPKQSREKTKLQFCHDLKLLYPFISKEITLVEFASFPSREIYIQPIESDGYNSELSKLNRDLTKEFVLNASIPHREIKISSQIHKLMEVE